jgi:DNA invertase Pin-like site-specific DNA recombinase
MASFAQLERELTLERTMAGLAAARARGRPLIHKTDKKEMAYDMYMKNDKTVKEIADALDMGRVTIYRYIKKRELENVA